MTYLLYPILGLLLVGLGFFIAKKNALLGNKRLVGYIVGAILVLSAPAMLGFLHYDFMPYGYMFLGVLYLILGWYNTRLARWIFGDKCKYRHEIILTCFLVAVSMLFFALVFNLCNELKYGAWASTCLLPFLIVSVFIQACRIFVEIPVPVYEIWKYADTEYPDTWFDPGTLQVIQIEIYKQESDPLPSNLSVKAPDGMAFGSWFRRMIDDYNVKSPKSPIDGYSGEKDGGWIFYIKPSLVSPRRYIDFNDTVKNNRVRGKHIVVAKRVKEQTKE